MCLEIFEDGFYTPSKVDTSSTNKLVTFTYFMLLSIAVMVKKKSFARFLHFKINAFHMIPESGLLSQRLGEFTSLHIKQQKMDIVDKEYSGSAQR